MPNNHLPVFDGDISKPQGSSGQRILLPVWMYECKIFSYTRMDCLKAAVYKFIQAGVSGHKQIANYLGVDYRLVDSAITELHQEKIIIRSLGNRKEDRKWIVSNERVFSDLSLERKEEHLGYMFFEAKQGKILPYFHQSPVSSWGKIVQDDLLLFLKDQEREPGNLPAAIKWTKTYKNYRKGKAIKNKGADRQFVAPPQEVGEVPYQLNIEQPHNLEKDGYVHILQKKPQLVYFPCVIEFSEVSLNHWKTYSPCPVDYNILEWLSKQDEEVTIAPIDKKEGGGVSFKEYIKQENDKFMQQLVPDKLSASDSKKLRVEDMLQGLLKHYDVLAQYPKTYETFLMALNRCRGDLNWSEKLSVAQDFCSVLENLFDSLLQTIPAISDKHRERYKNETDKIAGLIGRNSDTFPNQLLEYFHLPYTVTTEQRNFEPHFLFAFTAYKLKDIASSSAGNSYMQKTASLMLLQYEKQWYGRCSSDELERFCSKISEDLLRKIDKLTAVRNAATHNSQKNDKRDFSEDDWKYIYNDREIFKLIDLLLEVLEK